MNWIEYLKRYVGRGGGTQLAVSKSLIDALGHDGTTDLNTGVSAVLDTVESNIRGVDSDTLKTLSDQIDGLGGGVGDATLANQALIKDGNAADFDSSKDSLHDIRTLLDTYARAQSHRDYWSAPETLNITGSATTLTPGNTVAIPAGNHGVPAGSTIKCVHLLFKWRQTEDSSGATNAINSTTMKAQVDDFVNSGWLDALSFADNSYEVPGANYSVAGGDMVESITNVASRVAGSGTYDIQIVNAAADGGNLTLRDFQWGVRVWWGPAAETQSVRDFWSTHQNTVTLTTTSGVKTITPTVVVPSGNHGVPAGSTIQCVHLLFKWRQTEDSSGATNAINSTTMKAQVDDSVNSGWLDALSFADNAYSVDGANESIGAGDMVESITNIASRVDGADTYDIQIVNAAADGNNLVLRDVQWGLRVWWS